MPELIIPEITDASTLACISRSRKFTQYARAVDNALKGHCPFCKIDKAYNKVEIENDLCLAWHSNPPEDNTALHFLIVPRRHVKDSRELTDVELLTMWKTIPRELVKRFAIKSRGLLMRDGDAPLSAGTIEHLHLHLMVPNGTGRVESPFYKGAAEESKS